MIGTSLARTTPFSCSLIGEVPVESSGFDHPLAMRFLKYTTARGSLSVKLLVTLSVPKRVVTHSTA